MLHARSTERFSAALPCLTLLLSSNDVQDPMDGVLDPPMRSDAVTVASGHRSALDMYQRVLEVCTILGGLDARLLSPLAMVVRIVSGSETAQHRRFSIRRNRLGEAM